MTLCTFFQCHFVLANCTSSWKHIHADTEINLKSTCQSVSVNVSADPGFTNNDCLEWACTQGANAVNMQVLSSVQDILHTVYLIILACVIL